MKEDKQTREKLLQAGKEEFLQKGYTGASLRSICRKAGVTTGALYFFFDSKEDLFGSLVQEPLQGLYRLMHKHYRDEAEWAADAEASPNDMSLDMETAVELIDFLYDYQDAFLLLLTKAQGSRYENLIDDFVSITEKHHQVMAGRMAQVMHVEPVGDYMVHWLSHLMIFSFAQLLLHGLEREEALKEAQVIMRFLIGGWMHIFTS